MTSTVVVVGASGLVGTATVERFLRAGHRVLALSRRPPELDRDVARDAGGALTHLAVDLRDPAACAEALGGRRGITHLVYTAVHEQPGLVAGWRDPEQMRVNEEMLRNVLEPLGAAGELRHVGLLQGTKAYGAHLHPIPVPARERAPRDPHPNFYWLQEDLVRAYAARHGFDFTILRPQLIVGPNWGVVMNLPPIIGIYAALCRDEGRPFAFPGGAGYVWEAADCRLVADVLHWATHSPAAAGETFNVTNGDVFEWRHLWPAMARVLGIETGPDEPLRLAGYLPAQAGRWERIVARHGLRPLPLDALLGESHHYADLCFAPGSTGGRPPTFLSTVKLRQAGFPTVYDTEDSFCHWLEVLVERRIVPGG